MLRVCRATTTQFQRHYNASYPTVYTSIRRDGGINTSPLSEEEFVKALPRYPNGTDHTLIIHISILVHVVYILSIDGVLLIDVVKYNSMGILKNAESLAAANNKDGTTSILRICT